MWQWQRIVKGHIIRKTYNRLFFEYPGHFIWVLLALLHSNLLAPTQQPVSVDELNGNPENIRVDEDEVEHDQVSVQFARSASEKAIRNCDEVPLAGESDLEKQWVSAGAQLGRRWALSMAVLFSVTFLTPLSLPSECFSVYQSKNRQT